VFCLEERGLDGCRMKVISGGQTGVDRAALDAAIELGVGYGGSVPKGRKAEDGPIQEKYGNLRELSSESYKTRTEKNVIDADATLILALGPLRGGTALTARIAAFNRKPCLTADLQEKDEDEALREVAEWLTRVRPLVLNIAGPRESEKPGIYALALRFLRRVLSRQIR
jgi:hypothetical protein